MPRVSSLEELVIKTIISKNETDIEILNKKIHQLNQENRSNKIRLIELLHLQNPNIYACDKCSEQIGEHRCFQCHSLICEECTGFQDSEEMIYACNHC